jgi:hypothetical protein
MGRDSAIQLRERYSGVFVVGMGLALQETQRDRLARQTVLHRAAKFKIAGPIYIHSQPERGQNSVHP